MAIEIPSKSIYKIDNKKVLDNVYNSIECSYNEIDYSSDVILDKNYISYSISNNNTFGDGTIIDSFSENANDNFVINDTYRLGSANTYYVYRSNGYLIIDIPNRTKFESPNISIYFNLLYDSSTRKTFRLDMPFPAPNYNIYLNGQYNDMTEFIASLPEQSRRGFSSYFGWKLNNDKQIVLYFDFVRKTEAPESGTGFTLYCMSYDISLSTKVLKQTNVAIKGDVSPVLSVPTNELINSATEVQNTQAGTTQSLIDYLEDEVQYVYSQGLEMATVRCSVNNYYKYLGTTKEKSIDDDNKEMLFKIGDLVVPMKNTINGDEPLSKRNGAPKAFYVNAVDIINSGAIWQDLTLVETILGIITGILAPQGNNISGSAGVVADSTVVPTDYFLLGKRVNGQVVGGSTLVSKANQSNGAKYAPRTINYYISSDTYISGATQEPSGQGSGYTLSSPLTITVQGNHINTLNIKFDETKNVFATRMSIDDTDVINDSISMTQIVNGGLATHTIIIYAINRPNSPVIVSSINSNI